MSRLFLGLGAALILCTHGFAGSLASHLTFDRNPDVLDDDSVSFVADLDGDNALSVGDVISGVMRIGGTTANGILAPTDQLIGVYSLRVASTVGVAGASPEVVVTTAGVDPLDGTGLSIDEILATAGVVAPTVGSDAAVAVLSAVTPTDITSVPLAGFSAELSNYSLDAILGFGTASDFFALRSFSDIDDSGEIDFSEIAPSSFFAQEAGGMSVLHHELGGVEFLPVSVVHFDNSVTEHDVVIGGSLFGARATTPVGYSVTDSTFLTVNAVPEPSSFAVWGCLLVGAGVVRRRRNKK